MRLVEIAQPLLVLCIVPFGLRRSPAFLSGIKGYNKGLTAGREVRAAWMLLGNVVSLDDLREKGWEPGDDDIQDDTNNLYEAFERNPDD